MLEGPCDSVFVGATFSSPLFNVESLKQDLALLSAGTENSFLRIILISL